MQKLIHAEISWIKIVLKWKEKLEILQKFNAIGTCNTQHQNII